MPKPLLGAACDDVFPSSELCQGTEIQGEHVQPGEEQAATSRGQPEPRWLHAGILGPPLPSAVAFLGGWCPHSRKTCCSLVAPPLPSGHPHRADFFLGGGRMIFAASHSPYPWDDEGIPFILPDPSWKSCWDTSASPQPFFPTAQAQSNPPHRHKVGI